MTIDELVGYDIILESSGENIDFWLAGHLLDDPDKPGRYLLQMGTSFFSFAAETVENIHFLDKPTVRLKLC